MSRPRIDASHDPALRSWVEGAQEHAQFPIQNLPYGVFAPPGEAARAGAAIGDCILDLRAAAAAGALPADAVPALRGDSLNELFALAPAARAALRLALSRLLSDEACAAAARPWLHRADDCALQLPMRIGDYTDFYAGIHHAENVGRLFRPDRPLLANYKHLPIGYHGRASSVRASGAPVRRPHGQWLAAADAEPKFGPSRRLDFELELGVWIGRGNRLGEPVPIAEAHAHIAGLCLLNDWSARDLQAWEYQPLGPFLGKSFLTTVSPWVVTAEALAPFAVAAPARPAGDPAPLPYLDDPGDRSHGGYAIELEVALRTARMRRDDAPAQTLTRTAAARLYWTAAQMIAHHTSNGCNLQPGDLLGSGTVSGPGEDECGSLLERSRGGRQPLTLANGELRSFLEDGDEVSLNATARAPGYVPIGFGECRGRVVADSDKA
ncbi:fumarylacetoacetase [Lysobacter enzymogenes]|uniref:fumarylacetoacetase n=1 Tax=Lysobacter enzymogenes TaxID=69 RepID=UPI00099C3F23|nr:fumarylacetoacetase [Lysobacter enzymogenes]UZW60706.1 fumarylacetoacetase [Lysobacter enzymogenes]